MPERDSRDPHSPQTTKENMTIDIISDRIAKQVPITSPENITRQISHCATIAISGFGSVGYPKEIPLALANDSRDLSLTVVSGGSTGEEVDTELIRANAIERRFPYQARPESREAINNGSLAFHDRHISSLGDEVRYGNLADIEVAVIEAIAVGDGWLIPSTSIGHSPAFVEAADELFIEINESQPLDLQHLHDIYKRRLPPDRKPISLDEPDERIGSPRLTFDPSKLAGVVTTDTPDKPYSFRTPGPTERDISDLLSEFIQREIRSSPILEDAVYLQFGVGNIGNAMIEALESVDFDQREVHYYGEVFQDGLLDLLDDSVIESASATSLALSEDGQQRLFDNLDRYASDIVIRPGDVSNNATIIDQFGVVSVNSALSVDIFGHANSTHANGTHIINGIGGGSDFSRHSPLAITALPSMTRRSSSRIVPMVTHADHTEHDIDVVVTEHGVADLRGLSPIERAETLIDACAHPDVTPDLRQYLERGKERGGHIPHDLETAFSWT